MPDFVGYLERLQKGDTSLNPFLGFVGMRLESLGRGSARFRMTIRPEHLQGAGVMQGGLMAAMADEAIAHAIMTLLGPDEGITTVEMKSSFLAAARTGDLVAEAQVFKKGRSLVIGDCLVSDDSGRAVVRSSATFLLLRD